MIRLAIVGLGKIARDQHLPAIEKTEGIELVAIASRNATLEGVAHFTSLDELLASDVAVDAVALCTPPQVRREQAALALSHGKHVLLEKPPGATVSELAPLVAAAQASGKTLFATWHSRFAPAVEPARAFLAEHAPRAVMVEWKEDVRVWHPGQDWIFEPGGLGVFDPGINALSILTRILPNPFFLTKASLGFPANRDAPIEAALDFADSTGVPIRAELDFLQTGPQTWDIHVETGAGRLTLSLGGSRLFLDGKALIEAPEAEYPGIYKHFVDLVARGAGDVDLAPLQHVADAFLLGRRIVVAPFEG
ncbi:Gfo/Idh/MocA family protein [Ancylobacter defluvii]|uniref:Dehydrogenase n=1 Tax=Ancylobacter defluvii TaxID=1282440 RepID=A0A9W6NAC4_9HYPH|nr:Gfo/Idh/MocA family oxidoreductase [Ancylobacter defluvii]MBS7590401.1 Gfo/Idh/MocA family oxidoreductase [Ancylobacter defluvii]GLK83321.1 dehydrogenase [Ancylobacter defluvii]